MLVILAITTIMVIIIVAISLVECYAAQVSNAREAEGPSAEGAVHLSGSERPCHGRR